jgi:hypothetical protein
MIYYDPKKPTSATQPPTFRELEKPGAWLLNNYAFSEKTLLKEFKYQEKKNSKRTHLEGDIHIISHPPRESSQQKSREKTREK